MTDLTVLEQAVAKMERSDEDRLRFYSVLADAEIAILLDAPMTDDTLSPRMVEYSGGQYVLGFDGEARLAEYENTVASYVTVPGRVLAGMLAAENLGLALNIDVSDHSVYLPAQAMSWLLETLSAQNPSEQDGRITSVKAPGSVPDMLLETLGARLTQAAAGIAEDAYLFLAEFSDETRNHVLAIVGAEARAEPALARAVSEALTFSGIDAGFLDVVFLPSSHALIRRLRGTALRFEIPQPETTPLPSAPGSDPANPPKLR